MKDEKKLDLVLFYSAQDHLGLIEPLRKSLWQLGALHVDARQLPTESSVSPPELLVSSLKDSFFAVLVISKWLPIYQWPQPKPAEVELLGEGAIIVYSDLPATIMQRLCPALAGLEYLETNAATATTIAEYLVSILTVDRRTFFKRQEPKRREIEDFWSLAWVCVQLELGIMPEDQRELLLRSWPEFELDAITDRLGLNRSWIRFTRETLSFLDPADAAVAIIGALKDEETEWAPPTPRVEEVYKKIEQHDAFAAPSENLDSGRDQLDGHTNSASKVSPAPVTLPANSRDQIRIFISSTFRDMHRERELLTKHVFPQLRERCRLRGVELIEVDLRWGVTEEEAHSGNLIVHCLDEIERCRPYFVGLLGDRYGWIPKIFDAPLLERWPWLKDCAGQSITDIEIEYGALRDPRRASRALFYFRSSGFAARLPVAERSNHVSDSKVGADRLRLLKNRVRNSGLLVSEYETPELFAYTIVEDLWRFLQVDCPPERQFSSLEEAEEIQQQMCLDLNTESLTHREQYLQTLDAHVAGSGSPILLLGEAGSGKSALLSDWAQQYARTHPDTTVIFHSTQASLLSADLALMLGHIMAEIKERFEIQAALSIPVGDVQELAREFQAWLARGGEAGKLVIVIDGLDKLVDRNAQELGWLPALNTPNCNFILSTTAGRSAAALARRDLQIVEVGGLTREQQCEIVSTYFANFGKRMDQSLLDLLLNATETTSPGYLLTLLRELRLFGDYETLRAQMERYLQAHDLVTLFDLILSELEADYESSRPQLVKDALSIIWASRGGIPQSALLELLGSASAPLPDIFWAPLSVALMGRISQHFGLLVLTDTAFREAIRRRYLPTDQEVKAIHRHLATFHLSGGEDDAKWTDVLWHLRKGQSWQQLVTLLSDLGLLRTVWSENKLEVLDCWKDIETHTEFLLEEVFRAALDDPSDHFSSNDDLMPFIHLLAESGHTDAIKRLLAKLPGEKGKPIDPVSLDGLEQVKTPFLRGVILYKGGHFEGAVKEFTEEERLSREAHSAESLSLALIWKGQALASLDQLDTAVAAYRESEQISRLGGYKENLILALAAQARLFPRLGKEQEAQALKIELEYLRREMNNET
jgi:hypothetical protein